MGPLHWILVEFVPRVSWSVVAAGSVYYFRGEIQDFLKRATKIGPSGAEAAAPQPQTAPPTTPEAADTLKPPQLTPPEPTDDEVLARIEANIRETLRQRRAESFTPEQAKAFFVKEYAKLMLLSFYQNVGHIIFGTQIKLLKYLIEHRAQTRADIAFIYDEHEKKISESRSPMPPNFDKWMGYLLTSGLVALESGYYSITPLGRKFVVEFLPSTNISEMTRPA
ncbi:hypothetical protein SAMN05519103_09586 [Rhizobiales bacterium GAS113]|nr:hypothetical protein SAMN05519103_09586 [Rhizobiales bacterium GAS113]